MKNRHSLKVSRPLLGAVAGLCVCFGAADRSLALEKSAAAQAVWLDAFFARTNPFLALPVIGAPASPSATFQSTAPSLPGGVAAPAAVSTAPESLSPGGVSYAYQSFSSAALVSGGAPGTTTAVTAINPPPAAPPSSEPATMTASPSKRPKPPKPPKPPKASR